MPPGGPAEEAGKVAATFMDIMRAQPLSLALVIMNFALIGLIYFGTSTISERRAKEFERIMEQQEKLGQLLYNCVPVKDKTGGLDENSNL